MSGTNKNTKGRVEVTAMAASGTVLLSFNERMRWPFIVVDACGYGRQRLVSALKEMPQVRGRKRCSPFLRCPARNSKVKQYLQVCLPPVVREVSVMLSQLREYIHITAIGSFRIAVPSPVWQSASAASGGRDGNGWASRYPDRLPILLPCCEIGVAMKKEPQAQEGGGVFSVLSLRERRRYSHRYKVGMFITRSRSISPKTEYAQRSGALRRLEGRVFYLYYACSMQKAPDRMMIIARPW